VEPKNLYSFDFKTIDAKCYFLLSELAKEMEICVKQIRASRNRNEDFHHKPYKALKKVPDLILGLYIFL
jgi:hypothetical protein